MYSRKEMRQRRRSSSVRNGVRGEASVFKIVEIARREPGNIRGTVPACPLPFSGQFRIGLLECLETALVEQDEMNLFE